MLDAILKGLALGVVLSISVGPVIFSIIKQSITNGYKGGFTFIAGVSASDIAIVLVCNLFSNLFNLAISHQKIIGIIGSAFLIAMGIYVVFFKRVSATDDGKAALQSFTTKQSIRVFLAGFFMNTLNPGAFLFWFVASAAIISDAAVQASPIQYKLLVFGTCLIFVLLSDVAKVFLAGVLRQYLTLKNIALINKISGLILLGFGLALCIGLQLKK